MLAVTAACSSKKEWSDLPEEKPLSEFKTTQFLPTLEEPFQEGKNIVYAKAFLDAWNGVMQKINSPVEERASYTEEFKYLIKSKSHENVMDKDEYFVETDVVGPEILVRAFFRVKLPFRNKLHPADKGIKFININVQGFGRTHQDVNTDSAYKILYYLNDEHFAIKLIPEDVEHEIILAKGVNDFHSLVDGFAKVNQLIKEGEAMKKDSSKSWMYVLEEEDNILIPSFEYNIGTKYPKIEGHTFYTTDKKEHIIEEAYQRTGFIMNENGAVVESEANIAVDSIGVPEKKVPKNFIFDKPFLVIFKKVNAPFPYFMMKVENAELMVPFKD